jgi:hypothetical protein
MKVYDNTIWTVTTKDEDGKAVNVRTFDHYWQAYCWALWRTARAWVKHPSRISFSRLP